MKTQHTPNTTHRVLRGKLIAISTHKRKLERSHLNNLVTHLKDLEQKYAITPKRNRWQ